MDHPNHSKNQRRWPHYLRIDGEHDMKRKKILGLFMASILIFGMFSTITLGNPGIPTQASGQTITSQPEVKGKAAILVNAQTGKVIYVKNSHMQLPPASLTKIMTALLVIEHESLDQKVRISKHAAEIGLGVSNIALQPGEVLTREQLLYGCMLHSANDCATALAESTGGSESEFIKLMNQRARELKMNDTHFVNAHGLNDKDHYTSVYDLALLTRKAMTNPMFKRVVNTRWKVIPGNGHLQDRLLLNENRLLYRYQGAEGVKTGYTRQAGNCVVGAARRGKLELIAISMNSPAVYDDLERLLNYGFSQAN
jgi:D-alanyl-D-alanine carboxypeptidase (penicillin-binding protein 5/6)